MAKKMTARQRSVAAKVFEIFLSANDNEAAVAYNKLCTLGARMSDVAVHIKGRKWRTVHTGMEFELEDNFPLLPQGKSDG